jgi:hypothetical protein
MQDQHTKSISLVWQSSQIIKNDICLDTFFLFIYFTTITSTLHTTHLYNTRSICACHQLSVSCLLNFESKKYLFCLGGFAYLLLYIVIFLLHYFL